ncbi:GIY-YIG nuclease family protein [Streptomyces sp. SID6648]|nr:GIY-YIG nuclease family protein [Streptomyces sp. SID6648]
MTTYVYAISSAEQPAPVKIGKSTNVTNRLHQLQTASPVPLQAWWYRETTDPALEGKLHRHFADQRMSGEWFRFEHSDWPERIAAAAELLEEPQEDTLEELSRSRPIPVPSITVTHGHRPSSDCPEYTLEGAGEGDRCTCGHPATMHAGAIPYSCTSSYMGMTVHDPCECRSFRSTMPWSLDTWLAYASGCQSCETAELNEGMTTPASGSRGLG